MSLLEKYVEIPVDKLVHADWNYKKTDDKASLELMEKLKKNIAKNDQIENLLIREAKAEGYFEVVNGNHRLTALEALNKKSAVCFNLGKITQAHAERIAVETNETKFAADPLKLAELMVNIQKEFSVEDLIETMPMSADEIENYTKLVEFDWEQYNEESNIDNNPDDTDIQNNEGWRNLDIKLPVEVFDLFMDQLSRFKKLLGSDKDPDAIKCIAEQLTEVPDIIISGEDDGKKKDNKD